MDMHMDMDMDIDTDKGHDMVQSYARPASARVLMAKFVKTVDNLADFFTKPFWRRMISSACARRFDERPLC